MENRVDLQESNCTVNPYKVTAEIVSYHLKEARP